MMLTHPVPALNEDARNQDASTSGVMPRELHAGRPYGRPALAIAYWLSGALGVAAFIASVVGVVYPHVFRDPAMTAGNARGTSLVVLAIALPMLLVDMALAARGSLRARIIWLGALGYLVYNGVIFAFDTTFNGLFLVYVAMLSLAIWSLVALVSHADARDIQATFRSVVPPRVIATYLLVITALFAAIWLSQIVPALLAGGAPTVLQGTTMLTSPVHVLDLGFSLPVSALAAVWLWRRRPWGYLLAGSMLVMLTIESASIAVDQWFGHLSDPNASAAMTPVFAVFTLIQLVPTVALLMRLRWRGSPSEGKGA
ncbi:MAG TPA: hypothetical protein VE338_16015 [Ktedonobacterales bacterium]|nr:hypothetical protein [Ktedonobacterales bacterium]